MTKLVKVYTNNMPSGVFVRTQQHRENIRKALVGKKHSAEWTEKVAAKKRGTHQSVEAIRRTSEGNRGKIRTPEMKEKYRIASTISMKKRLENGWKPKAPMLGRKHSEATKQKMSEARSNEKHWKWAGGITPKNLKIRHSRQYVSWRNLIFTRDNWTCKKCGVKGGNLVAHHIRNFAEYPELRFDLDNGITLHNLHHVEFHKIYGKTGNTFEQIKEYIYGNQ